MISSVTPDILQNLKAVLNKIMPNGPTKSKYVNALEDAIDNIKDKELVYSTLSFDGRFSTNDTGSLIIDIFTHEGTLVDTLEYCAENLISDDEAGEA